jgi:hypothetical protein
LFQDEGAVAQAFPKVLHRLEPASFKSHIERVLSIRVPSKEFQLLYLLLMLPLTLALVAGCLEVRYGVLFLKLS